MVPLFVLGIFEYFTVDSLHSKNHLKTPVSCVNLSSCLDVIATVLLNMFLSNRFVVESPSCHRVDVLISNLIVCGSTVH